MASIILRGTKWQVKIRVQGQPHLSRTFTTKQAAERWAAEHGNIDTGPTVGDLFKKYIAQVAPHRRSGDWERCILQRMLRREKVLCAVPIAVFGKPHLAEWRDRRVTEVQGSTVGRELDAI
ncbi:MAG TPA: site-specific integrase, partial [Paraburkholderia sp.]